MESRKRKAVAKNLNEPEVELQGKVKGDLFWWAKSSLRGVDKVDFLLFNT